MVHPETTSKTPKDPPRKLTIFRSMAFLRNIYGIQVIPGITSVLVTGQYSSGNRSSVDFRSLPDYQLFSGEFSVQINSEMVPIDGSCYFLRYMYNFDNIQCLTTVHHICLCICIYVHIYIYMCIHIYIYTNIIHT